jgi:glycine/D-amino acid oxidase-like deaminating enzyme
LVGRAIVIGGGVVGLSIAIGLAKAEMEVVVLDGPSHEPRASFGNAGLIWVQGKGLGCPSYAEWTRRSASIWPSFAAGLRDGTGIDVEYGRPGGFNLCLDDAELTARQGAVSQMSEQLGDRNDVQLVDRDFVRERLSCVGPSVVAASWCPSDGHVNPLLLTHALAALTRPLGIAIINEAVARSVGAGRGGRLRVESHAGNFEGDRVVIAAGLATEALAKQAEMVVPLKPVRGQIVVTERIRPAIAHPTPTIRQSRGGSVLFGNSHEETCDPDTTLPVLAGHAQRALREFPFLASVRVLRAWGAIRVMPRDGLPIYATSQTLPGAFAIACHSGITLAAAHATILAPAIVAGTLPPFLMPFSPDRFNVPSNRPH